MHLVKKNGGESTAEEAATKRGEGHIHAVDTQVVSMTEGQSVGVQEFEPGTNRNGYAPG